MKIESGRYYKTRDGRKVGPIEHAKDYDNEYPWWHNEGQLIFDKNGYNAFNRHDDLVEEWADEPTHQDIGKLTLDMDMTPNLAALAAQHRIKITVQVGELLVEYDGRD